MYHVQQKWRRQGEKQKRKIGDHGAWHPTSMCASWREEMRGAGGRGYNSKKKKKLKSSKGGQARDQRNRRQKNPKKTTQGLCPHLRKPASRTWSTKERGQIPKSEKGREQANKGKWRWFGGLGFQEGAQSTVVLNLLPVLHPMTKDHG